MMSSNIRRRYNFVLKDITTGDETLIKNYFGDHNEFGRENYVLSSIDEITLNYSNQEDLMDMLRQYLGLDAEHFKIYIKYRENKQDRYLNIVYDDKLLLKQFANKSQTLLQDNFLQRKIYQHFMSNITKGNFYRYMTENHYINDRLNKKIYEYLYENNIYSEKEITTHLKNYRVIRDYIVGIFNYNKTITNDNMKIKYNSIDYKEVIVKTNEEQKPLNLKTDDAFLNTLTNVDDVLKYYDLDDLINLDDDTKIIDGMGPKGKVKTLKRE